MGKFSKQFQEYLQNENIRKGPDHSIIGGIYSCKILEPLIFVVAGHHAGLADAVNLKKRMLKNKTSTTQEIIDLAVSIIDELTGVPDLYKAIEKRISCSDNIALEFLIRMIFSCLVDADYLDTERHFNPQQSKKRYGNYLIGDELTGEAKAKVIRELNKNLSEHYSKLKNSAESSELNDIRNKIYEDCLRMATNKPGIYRLTVPTGGGKTLSGMAFALKHAEENNLEKIIVTIPYTSIIEQTADIYTDIFGRDKVLEHHSAVEVDSENTNNTMRLAAENWEAPIVVTTTVQLFESIFSNRPSKCRKIHNLARSVIVLDEVQTLPVSLLAPILNVLQELVDNYNTTVVLCTATQPAFTGGPYLEGLKNLKEIVSEPKQFYSSLKRVDYQIPAGDEKWTWERVANEINKHNQCLVVVNTKKDAMSLLKEIRSYGFTAEDGLKHLSTLMCAAHRRQVLGEVKKRLKDRLPCILISTQVIEAGVDISFPVVMRSIGPLDRIVQVAGRCNREGKLKGESGELIKGQVIVFDPEEGGLPRGDYRTATDIARNTILSGKADFHAPDTYEQYFKALYQTAETDANQIQQKRKGQPAYEEIAKSFKMINSPTIPVLVNYVEKNAEINKIRSQIEYSQVTKGLVRKMQPFLVNVYENQRARLMNEGLIGELAEGLYEWKGIYDPICGIVESTYDPEVLTS